MLMKCTKIYESTPSFWSHFPIFSALLSRGKETKLNSVVPLNENPQPKCQQSKHTFYTTVNHTVLDEVATSQFQI